MSSSINPFDTSLNDLGADSTCGIDRATVGNMLLEAQYGSGTPCLICGNTASYRLIPKTKLVNTAEIQTKGFICEHCLRMNYLDSSQYGIRPL